MNAGSSRTHVVDADGLVGVAVRLRSAAVEAGEIATLTRAAGARLAEVFPDAHGHAIAAEIAAHVEVLEQFAARIAETHARVDKAHEAAARAADLPSGPQPAAISMVSGEAGRHLPAGRGDAGGLESLFEEARSSGMLRSLHGTRPYGQPGGLNRAGDMDEAIMAATIGPYEGVPFPSPVGRGDVAEWVKYLNDGGPGVFGRDNNCLDCALSVVATWFGRTTVSAPRTESNGGEAYGPRRARDWAGGDFVDVGAGTTGASAVAGRLTDLGHGAACVLWGWRSSPGSWSHAWNAVNYDGSIYWIDAQHGVVSTVPLYTDKFDRLRAIVMSAEGVAA